MVQTVPINVLMIEDDPQDARLIKILLSKIKVQTYAIEQVDRVSLGIEKLSSKIFDVILLDLHLPDSSGLDTVLKVVSHAKKAPIIVFTVQGDIEIATKAIKAGAQDYLVKDTVESDQLGRSIRYAIERKQIKDALDEEKDKAKTYLDIAGAIILVLDTNEIVSLINKRGCIVLGCAESSIMGKNWFDNFVPEQWRAKSREFFHLILEGEFDQIPENESFVQTTTGDQRLVSWKFSPVLDENGKYLHLLCSGDDITEQKLAEEEMHAASNRASFFNDLLMHDIGKIVQKIAWNFEVLQQRFESGDDDKQPYETIRDCFVSIWSLLDKVQKFSELESISLKDHEIDVFDFLEHAVNIVKNSLPSKKLVIVSNIHPHEYSVVANEFLLDVFKNILDNALKFHSSAEVKIDVIASQAADPNFLKIEFKDYGPGIPDAKKSSLFTRLIKTERRAPSSGIGLALVARIIDEIGGKIWVENREEDDYSKGTNVVVLLPRKRLAR